MKVPASAFIIFGCFLMPKERYDEFARRRVFTEVPKGIEYDLAAIEAQTSFGGTLKGAVEQVEKVIGTRLSCENLADIIEGEFPPERTLISQTLRGWLTGCSKPASIKDAKAVARAFRLPEEYFTRFYRTATPLYGKS